jgi:cytosine deaminase
MHRFRRARVPLACLPQVLQATAPGVDPLIEPWRECDVTVAGDRITSVEASAAESRSSLPGETDLGGRIVFPGLVEVHTHLDKCHTWDRAPGRHSDFWESLRILGEDRVNWSEADIYRRASFALRTAWAHGTNALRTHIDTADQPGIVGEAGHATLARLREEWAGRITVQTVTLCGLGGFSHGAPRHLVELSARHGATAFGGFPQPNPDLPRQLDNLMAAARELGLGLDLHVDESDLLHAECLRATAEAVLRNQFPFPVACGHSCSLAVHDPIRAAETIALVKAAGIKIISLPLTNLHLMGRRRTAPRSGEAFGRPLTPFWRGTTLLHEFAEAGVTIACGGDNVRDAFYGWGDFDMMETFQQSVRVAHLDTRMGLSPGVITSAPAEIMGLPQHGRVDAGSPADLVVFEARSLNQLLARPGAPRQLIRGESFRPAVPPDYTELER